MEATPLREGNLGEEERSRRLRGGVLVFGVGIALAVLALKLGASQGVLAALFLPFGVGANGIYSALFNC
jgi:hypothetical protein